jgi:hypothetical protein
MDTSRLPFPKGDRAAEKRRRDRLEAAVIEEVRAQCVARDGFCRWTGAGLGACAGPSEWAHFNEKKRFKTRGMDPRERHTTAGSLMMCRRHHRLYDAGRMQVEPLTERGADGRLRAECGEARYEEAA